MGSDGKVQKWLFWSSKSQCGLWCLSCYFLSLSCWELLNSSKKQIPGLYNGAEAMMGTTFHLRACSKYKTLSTVQSENT